MARPRALAALTSSGGRPVRRSSAAAQAGVRAGTTEHSAAPVRGPPLLAASADRSSASIWSEASSAVMRPLVSRQKPLRSGPWNHPTTVSLLPTSTAISPPRERVLLELFSGMLPSFHGLGPGPAPGDQPRQSDADEVEQRHRHAHHHLRR